jgi:transposase-like protein
LKKGAKVLDIPKVNAYLLGMQKGSKMSVLNASHFKDEAAAYAFVEARVWPKGRICPHCGIVDKSGPLKGKSTRPGVYKCYACRKPFTVKIGTIFEKSHIPMHVWVQAMFLLCSSKKGMSANQLHRILGITLKSAWFMAHRIREAMAPGDNAPRLGGKGKVVEADETFLSKSRKTKKPPGYRNDIAVLSLIERGGSVRSFPLSGQPSRDEIIPALFDNVSSKSTLHTDGAQYYKFNQVVPKHESVDHSKQYVRYTSDGKVHTNSAEGYFSIFKRGMVGIYQHCEAQHLHRYLAEFDFRMSNRVRLGVDDAERTSRAIDGAKGKRLTYAELIQ